MISFCLEEFIESKQFARFFFADLVSVRGKLLVHNETVDDTYFPQPPSAYEGQICFSPEVSPLLPSVSCVYLSLRCILQSSSRHLRSGTSHYMLVPNRSCPPVIRFLYRYFKRFHRFFCLSGFRATYAIPIIIIPVRRL